LGAHGAPKKPLAVFKGHTSEAREREGREKRMEGERERRAGK